MRDIVKAFDGLPWIIKLILALPFIDGLAWGIYRIAKGVSQNNGLLIIIGIIWVFVGFFLLWVIDLFSVIVHGKPIYFV
jgi:hypothetical protein